MYCLVINLKVCNTVSPAYNTNHIILNTNFCRVLGRLTRVPFLNAYVWVFAFGGSRDVKKTLSLSAHHSIISPGD